MNLDGFKLASIEEIKAAKQPPKGSKAWSTGAAILPWSPGGIHPTLVYKVMRQTFGECNTDYIDENSTWEWVIKTDKGLLSIYNHKWWWSIGYAGTDEGLREKLRGQAEILKAAILNKASEVKISKRQIDTDKIGGAITNPYALFGATTQSLLAEAIKLIREAEQLRSAEGATVKSDVEDLNRAFSLSWNAKSFLRAAFITNYLALEGFANLVYTIFLKKRYQNEIYRRQIENKNIILKLLEMDRYCADFEMQVLSPDEELFQALKYLKNVRNNFLHANIAEGMQSHLIVVEGYPVLKEEEAGKKYGISTQPGQIDVADVVRSKRLVEKIVVGIINALRSRIRRKFAIVHCYWSVTYYFDKNGAVLFLLGPDDYVPDEEIDVMLSLSRDLDDEYYNVTEDR
jgi:hypothetical protein